MSLSAKEGFYPELSRVPASELQVVAMRYVYRDDDAVIEEVEVWDKELREGSALQSAWRPEAGSRLVCAHCGSTSMKYPCELVHVPTMKRYFIGRTCATEITNISHDLSTLGARLKERGERSRAVDTWLGEQPAPAVAIVRWAMGSESTAFARDVVSGLRKFGRLSPKQVALLARLRDEETARLAEGEPVSVAPVGDGVLIEGEVVGLKLEEGQFGETWKMCVRHADGWKCWSSVPRALGEVVRPPEATAGDDGYGLDRGDVVRFVANTSLSRFNPDEYFCFAKRPRKAAVVNFKREGVAA